MGMDRRSFIKRTAAAGGGLVSAQGFAPFATAASSQRRPNVLVIMVDQLRTPQWFPTQDKLDALLPNLARIRGRATSFERHYTAANMCVASRGALLTGLYPHQTGCMLTKAVADSSTLSAKFPTWGTMLREQGYETTWWGKWHLGPEPDKTEGALESYGFDGGTYPSPNGNPGQGSSKDPGIVDQFTSWLAGAGAGPWCTTVSLVNPHDINWWPRFTIADDLLAPVGHRFAEGPPNVETAAQLRASKPRLQTALRETTAMANGPIPDGGPAADASWAEMLTLYLVYQQQVDTQIGRVLDALHARPELEANTIVVFTADHGEYCGSHGLRAKGGGVYEEAIRVPLYIVDPTGRLSGRRPTTRTHLTSTVDIAPMLLTFAHGSASWRAEPRYSHIANRADIAEIAADPRAKGRPWIAHVTDETTVEELSYTHSFADEAPHHVTAVRTPTAKYAVYSAWKDGTIEVDRSDQDFELYDHSADGGALELDNVAGTGSKLESDLSRLLARDVIAREVRAPLPSRLGAAQREGLSDYYARTAERIPPPVPQNGPSIRATTPDGPRAIEPAGLPMLRP